MPFCITSIALCPFAPRGFFFREILGEINHILGSYFRGQLIVASVLAVYYSISLFAFSMNFGIILRLLTGLLTFIPYVGFFISSITALILSLIQFSTGTEIGAVALIYVGGYTLEVILLTPKFWGERTGLHPVWILFSLFA